MNALLSLTLKGSAIGALLLAVTAVGCSSDSKDDDETGGKGGSSTAGTSSDDGGDPNEGGKGGDGAGGTPAPGDGGTGGGDGGTGGSPVVGAGGDAGSAGDAGASSIGNGEGGAAVTIGSGPAEGKFCNTLSFGDEENTVDTTFILKVGTGSDEVTFTAKTGECVPADGLACQVLPEGNGIQITLADADNPDSIIETSEADILEGQDWIFFNSVEDGAPITNGFPIDQREFECKDVKYENLP